MAAMGEQQWRAWKTQLVPLLYDWYSNHNIMWPSQACRWGRRLEELQYKTRHTIFYSEQTNPELHSNEPPKLLVAEAEVPKPRVASSELVSTWTDMGRCPFIRDIKTLVHPGEVNKIRDIPQHPAVIVTHTDAPELYVWNTATQPSMVPDQASKTWGVSTPDITLTGHKDEAQFPLATASNRPMVASGGTDKLVLLWDLDDAAGSGGLLAGAADGGSDQQQLKGPGRTTKLGARHTLAGHKDTVEDVVFQPGSSSHLVSVGDDKQVLFWDTATGSRPVAAIQAAHGSGPDVHCVDWSGLQEHLVVTGAADGSLIVWDRRKLPAGGGGSGGAAAAAATTPPTGALKVFSYHKEAVMRVEWSPHTPGILASGGEDHLVVVWNMDRGAAAAAAGAGTPGGGSSRGSKAAAANRDTPPEVLFKHVGHRGGKVVDFQWCPQEAWTLMSVSENAARGTQGSAAGDDDDDDEAADRGGGTLQIWRLNDLLYRPEDEVLAELEAHKEWIVHGRKPPAAVLQHIEEKEQAMADELAAAAEEQLQLREGEQQLPGGEAGAGGGSRGATPAGAGGASASAGSGGGGGQESGDAAAGAANGGAGAAAEGQQQQQQQPTASGGDAVSAQPMDEE